MLVTTAERLRAEGHRRARAHAYEQGRAAARVEILVELLFRKFGALSPAVVTVILTATTEQTRIWIPRLLTANTLEEFFA